MQRRRWQWSALFACLLPGAAIPAPAFAAPYLKVTGVIALRFQKQAGFHAPPKPTAETTIVDPTLKGPDIITPEKPVVISEVNQDPLASAAQKSAPVVRVRPILPDDMMPRLVPEDVLPYFQLPVSTPEKTLSTATYKQQ